MGSRTTRWRRRASGAPSPGGTSRASSPCSPPRATRAGRASSTPRASPGFEFGHYDPVKDKVYNKALGGMLVHLVPPLEEAALHAADLCPDACLLRGVRLPRERLPRRALELRPARLRVLPRARQPLRRARRPQPGPGDLHRLRAGDGRRRPHPLRGGRGGRARLPERPHREASSASTPSAPSSSPSSEITASTAIAKPQDKVIDLRDQLHAAGVVTVDSLAGRGQGGRARGDRHPPHPRHLRGDPRAPALDRRGGAPGLHLRGGGSRLRARRGAAGRTSRRASSG